MKKQISDLIYFLLGVALLTAYCSVGNSESVRKEKPQVYNRPTTSQVKVTKPTKAKTVKTHKTTTASKWARTLESLVLVESGGDPTARNTATDAVGILQIRPMYVNEVNRIVGKRRYTLADRYSVKKSIEMFQIIQEYYNPQHSIEKAIQLHNPTATLNYHDKVVAQIRELRNQENYVYQYAKYL
jgi:hypothetical protein